MQSEVVAVSRALQIAILDSGEEVPAKTWLDNFGDECDTDDASAVIAGPCHRGFWYAIDLLDLEPGTIH